MELNVEDTPKPINSVYVDWKELVLMAFYISRYPLLMMQSRAKTKVFVTWLDTSIGSYKFFVFPSRSPLYNQEGQAAIQSFCRPGEVATETELSLCNSRVHSPNLVKWSSYNFQIFQVTVRQVCITLSYSVL